MQCSMQAAPAARGWNVSARALGALTLWFGLMRFWPFEVEALAKALSAAGAPAWAECAVWLSPALGALETAIGASLLLAPAGAWRKGAALAAMLFWGAGLLWLLTPAAWIHSPPYGGFPVIGSGQTVLKHLGIAGLALGVFAQQRGCGDGLRRGLYAMWAGQLLVLVWIGLMKFTAVEAEGVAGLMRPSPLFNWLYAVFDEQGASNFIGVVELILAGAIALWPWRPRIARWGLWGAVATYVLTNTFLFTTPGWQPGYGFPFVGGTGQFLLKDLLLLVGAVLLLRSAPPAATRA
ncbi:DUF417 family protein [Pseudomonas sp. CGJS7]|uniref:DUF417 family protein n=1 Tax=Pseudomonas sp. CGJS7 TaxID=3109348 RepID=UPI003008E7AD